jgi:hypothetical protein
MKMINFNDLDGKFFVCDNCGTIYTFSHSFLTILKKQKFCPFNGNLQSAIMDLCRECAGQEDKIPIGSMIYAKIAHIEGLTKQMKAARKVLRVAHKHGLDRICWYDEPAEASAEQVARADSIYHMGDRASHWDAESQEYLLEVPLNRGGRGE